MKKTGILNPLILNVIAKAGHRDMIAVTDRGFPLATNGHMTTIDVSIVQNLPTVLDIVIPLLNELVVEEIIIARETIECQPEFLAVIREKNPGVVETVISHAELKQLLLTSFGRNERMIGQIRTGEFSPYMNVILVCGVAFS